MESLPQPFPYAAMLADLNSLGLYKDWCCQESQFAVLIGLAFPNWALHPIRFSSDRFVLGNYALLSVSCINDTTAELTSALPSSLFIVRVLHSHMP